MSCNNLTAAVAEQVADALRGIYERGRKVSDTVLKRIVMSNNEKIGAVASKSLMFAAANDTTEHVLSLLLFTILVYY
jgi:hypothetical protein